MTHDLFFIPLIARALQEPDVRRALAEAFGQIEQLANRSGYEHGYSQFQSFMSAVHRRRELLQQQSIRRQMLECLMADNSESERRILEAWLKHDSELKREYETLSRQLNPEERVPQLRLFREGTPIGQLTWQTTGGSLTIDDIIPGSYSLQLDTGLVIWEGMLTSRELIWKEAFGHRRLELAAEAGEIQRTPTRQVDIPDACLLLRIFAGIESGSMEIELTRPGG